MSGGTASCAALLAALCALAGAQEANPDAQRKPAAVILAWDGTGDFGPQTPGTKTAGWQEAIDCCVREARDLYVQGGWGGRKAIYHASDTIRIPATQDFRIDGGVYVLNWTGPPDDPGKDLMVIDSTMNGEYHFGIFVYGGAGAALRVRPENPVPIDGFAVVVETEIKSQGIADPRPFEPGERKAGTGLVLDATKAPIVSSRFDFVGGILNFKTCVEASGAFVQSEFNCLHLHTNADKSVLFDLGPACTQNSLRLTIGVDQGAQEVRGICIQGRNNSVEVNTRGGFPKGNDVILEPTAAGNRITLLHGKTVFDPDDFLTDDAQEPTNELIWTGPNISPRSLTFPPGQHSYTQRLYPASLRVVRGAWRALQLLRGTVSSEYPAQTGAALYLGPGDAIRFECEEETLLEILPMK